MTNEQKIIIFKEAIVILKESQQFCLCGALWAACGGKKNEDIINIISNRFPELLNYKPENIEGTGAYWWPKDEIKPRIEVLEKAIKELETTNL